MQMREALIIALQSYQGSVILVSHDRHLLRSCADDYYIVADGKVAPYRDDLDAYQEYVRNSFSNATNSSTKKEKPAVKKSKAINNSNAKKLVALERDIAKLEERLAKLDVDLADVDLYQAENAAKLQKLQQQREEVAAKLEDRQEQWLRLAE